MKPFICTKGKAIHNKKKIFESGKYYIISGDSCFLTKKQVESCISVIRLYLKRFKKKRNVLNLIQFNVPVTRKTKGARMGSGKGKIKEYIAKINLNSILFILQKVKQWRALSIFKYMRYRLPMKIYLKYHLPKTKEKKKFK